MLQLLFEIHFNDEKHVKIKCALSELPFFLHVRKKGLRVVFKVQNKDECKLPNFIGHDAFLLSPIFWSQSLV